MRQRFEGIFNSVSIRAKLMLSYAVIFLPIIIISQFIIFTTARSLLEQQSINYLSQTTSSLSQQLSASIDEVSRYSKALISNPRLIGFLSDYNNGSAKPTTLPSDVHDIFKWVISQRPDISNIFIYTNEEAVFGTGIDFVVGQEYSAERGFWYEEVKKRDDGYLLVPPRIHKGYYSYEVFSVMQKVIPIYSKEEFGVLRIDVHSGIFERIVTQNNNAECVAIIYDSSGIPVYRTRQTEKVISSEVVLQIGERLKEQNGHFVMDEGLQSERIVSFSQDGKSGLYVVLSSSANALFKESRKTQTKLLIYLLIGGVFAFVFAAMISGSISKSVKTVLTSMEKVKKGDFKQYISLNTKGELAALENGFNSMLRKIKELFDANAQIQVEKKVAELKLLHSQINPHFLYNTLDMLRMKTLKNNDTETHDLILQLADLLRAGVKGTNDFLPLDKEIDYMSKFLSISNARTEHAIEFIVDINPTLMNTFVPKFILQPLAENIVMHGFFGKNNLKRVVVTADAKNGFLSISVKDNGVGMSKDRLREVQSALVENGSNYDVGIGLKNINMRLKLYYGEESGLEINSILGKGTTAIIKINTNVKLPEVDGFREL
ncbi:MAG: sensor histidine kinase [Firmicutes bacterium]|nr:sensor histidine kinase [Bacillota bacterium]